MLLVEFSIKTPPSQPVPGGAPTPRSRLVDGVVETSSAANRSWVSAPGRVTERTEIEWTARYGADGPETGVETVVATHRDERDVGLGTERVRLGGAVGYIRYLYTDNLKTTKCWKNCGRRIHDSSDSVKSFLIYLLLQLADNCRFFEILFFFLVFCFDRSI